MLEDATIICFGESTLEIFLKKLDPHPQPDIIRTIND